MAWISMDKYNKYGWQGIKTGGGALPPDYNESGTGANVEFKMDELSGDIVDEIAGVTLIDVGTPTYNVAGSDGYSPGITTASGNRFVKSPVANEPNHDLGTNDANILVVCGWDAESAGTHRIWGTTEPGTGNSGWLFFPNGGAGFINLSFSMVTTTAESVAATWSSATVRAAWASTSVHTWEVQINRTADTAELFLDDASMGTVDISALTTSITGAGVGVADDYRNFTGAPYPGTIYYLRKKGTLT